MSENKKPETMREAVENLDRALGEFKREVAEAFRASTIGRLLLMAEKRWPGSVAYVSGAVLVILFLLGLILEWRVMP